MCCFAPSNITISSFPLALPTEQILSLLRSGSAGNYRNIFIYICRKYSEYSIQSNMFYSWSLNVTPERITAPTFQRFISWTRAWLSMWDTRDVTSRSHFSSSTVSQLQLETRNFCHRIYPTDLIGGDGHNSGNTLGTNIFNRFEFQGSILMRLITTCWLITLMTLFLFRLINQKMKGWSRVCSSHV